MSKLRIVVMSDLHGALPTPPPCDLLILSGDMGPEINPDDPFHPINAYRQLDWFNTKFAAWLHNVRQSGRAQEIVATPGNHDFGLYRVRHGLQELPWHLLIDQGVELFGFRIWGSPWTGGDISSKWAFKLDEDTLKVRWSRIPDDADIVVLHSPPFEILDQVESGKHIGSKSLAERMGQINPKLVTFGHIHESYGTVTQNNTVFVNASMSLGKMSAKNLSFVNRPHTVLLDRPVVTEVVSAA